MRSDKVIYKKKVYEFEKDCEDDFGKYHWYFYINKLFTLKGIYYELITSDLYTSRKTLKECLDVGISHLERKNPRYYRLKENMNNLILKATNNECAVNKESFEKVDDLCNDKEIKFVDKIVIKDDNGQDIQVKTQKPEYVTETFD